MSDFPDVRKFALIKTTSVVCQPAVDTFLCPEAENVPFLYHSVFFT